jgi:hypothetical protein
VVDRLGLDRESGPNESDHGAQSEDAHVAHSIGKQSRAELDTPVSMACQIANPSFLVAVTFVHAEGGADVGLAHADHAAWLSISAGTSAVSVPPIDDSRNPLADG